MEAITWLYGSNYHKIIIKFIPASIYWQNDKERRLIISHDPFASVILVLE
jgi:hypothetical protein